MIDNDFESSENKVLNTHDLLYKHALIVSKLNNENTSLKMQIEGLEILYKESQKYMISWPLALFLGALGGVVEAIIVRALGW